MKKQQITQALRAFINQRSGIDFRNYQTSDWKSSRESFMGDYRPMLRHGKQARAMLRSVELRESIAAENLISASRAFCGRLKFVERDGGVCCEYTTGQYFPTEYRAAACAVLAQCLWDYWNECSPDGSKRDYIVKQARSELGRGIAREWFN